MDDPISDLHLWHRFRQNWFHLVAMDREYGHVFYSKQNAHSFTTETVHQHDLLFCRLPSRHVLVPQYWGRLFQQAFEPKIIPAQFVKPYLKSNKNDFNDATAIAEAGSRGTLRAVSR